MSDEPRDTGDLLAVPEDQQLDEDPTDDPAHTAETEDGAGDDLADVYEQPGAVVGAEELQ